LSKWSKNKYFTETQFLFVIILYPLLQLFHFMILYRPNSRVILDRKIEFTFQLINSTSLGSDLFKPSVVLSWDELNRLLHKLGRLLWLYIRDIDWLVCRYSLDF